MSILRILAAAGIAAATAAISAPAYSALPPSSSSFDYSVTGFVNGMLLSGSGIGSISGGQISGITFTMSAFGGPSTSYTDVTSLSTAGNIEATTSGGLGGKAVILTYAGPSIFTGSGGAAPYEVFTGSSLGSVTNSGSQALVADVRISPVPLPGAVALFGSAVVAVGGFVRLRRRKAA